MGGDKMAKKVHTFFSISNQIAFYFNMAHKIMAIRERLDATANDWNKFQLIEHPLQINKGEGEGPNSLIRTRRISCWERRG